MTFGEIFAVIRYNNEKLSAESKDKQQNAAFTAFYGAYYSRVSDFPDSLVSAFPWLYGRTETGGVSVEDWRESKRAMDLRVQQHNNAINMQKGGQSY